MFRAWKMKGSTASPAGQVVLLHNTLMILVAVNEAFHFHANIFSFPSFPFFIGRRICDLSSVVIRRSVPIGVVDDLGNIVGMIIWWREHFMWPNTPLKAIAKTLCICSRFQRGENWKWHSSQTIWSNEAAPLRREVSLLELKVAHRYRRATRSMAWSTKWLQKQSNRRSNVRIQLRSNTGGARIMPNEDPMCEYN